MGGWVENDLRSAHSLISRETKKNETGSSPPHPTGVEQLIAEQPSMPSGNKNVGQVERIVKLPQRRTLTKQVFREKKHSGHVPPRAACAEDSSQTGNAANSNRRKIRKKMCGWVVMGVRMGVRVVVGRGWFLRLHRVWNNGHRL